MRLMSVICHLSSLTSADNAKCQMLVMTDDGNNLHQYGCLQRCSNLVEIINWLDHFVRNESQCGPHAYFPLYIFGISFIKWKRMAPENESLKTLDLFWFHLFRYKGSHMQKMGQNKAFCFFWDTLMDASILPTQASANCKENVNWKGSLKIWGFITY